MCRCGHHWRPGIPATDPRSSACRRALAPLRPCPSCRTHAERQPVVRARPGSSRAAPDSFAVAAYRGAGLGSGRKRVKTPASLSGRAPRPNGHQTFGRRRLCAMSGLSAELLGVRAASRGLWRGLHDPGRRPLAQAARAFSAGDRSVHLRTAGSMSWPRTEPAGTVHDGLPQTMPANSRATTRNWPRLRTVTHSKKSNGAPH